MMVTALLLRPWILLMRKQNVRARVFTDDMLIAAHGPECISLFRAALDTTHVYLKLMGAKIT